MRGGSGRKRGTDEGTLEATERAADRSAGLEGLVGGNQVSRADASEVCVVLSDDPDVAIAGLLTLQVLLADQVRLDARSLACWCADDSPRGLLLGKQRRLLIGRDGARVVGLCPTWADLRALPI